MLKCLFILLCLCYNGEMKDEILDVFDISYEGAGVGKLDGKVVFVPKVLPGERVEVEILDEKSSFARARVKEIKVAGKSRIEAKCPYYDLCGGCDFQHCTREKELRLKQQILSKELQKVGFLGEIEPVCGDNRFFYRNKLKLEVRNGVLGFFQEKSRNFFEVHKCVIASEKINDSLPKIQQFIKENNFKELKSVYIKEVGNSVGICFLFDKNAKNQTKNTKKLDILSDFSVFFAFGDVLESDKTKIFCVFGDEKLHANLDGVDVQYDMSAFNQINNQVAEKLYQFVLDFVAGKRVVNAYSGQGLLTFLMSKTAKFVYGIEYQKSAHHAAEKLCKNVKEFKIQNICDKVENCLQRVLLSDKIDVLVLDPAREGCHRDVLSEIFSSNIPQIVYISCNFSTLVRDLKVLGEKYEISKVKMFDMFPCTSSLETVAVLRLK